MNNKESLQLIFNGGVPDFPPHFELTFQIEKEMFDMDRKAIEDRPFSSEADRKKVLIEFDIELKTRLIDDLGWAAVPAMCYEPYADRIKDITALKNAVGSKALVFTKSESGVFWMPTGTDLMDFVIDLFENPGKMHQLARMKCEAAKELARNQVDAGADFIFQNTDFGFNQGPFISPKHFSEFVTPYMTEIVGTIHDLGIPVILHSDGDLRLLLEDIHSTGIDGYQSIDPQGQMNIKEVREKYPDWILMGNVNCSMLQETNSEQICSSVQHCMTHGGIGKRYIFSTSNCIFHGMPSESYKIMLGEYKRINQKDNSVKRNLI
jgi:uroporphyrinogen decarboxylase